MVGVCRPAPTDQARLFGHELDVLLVTKAAWLRMGKPALINAIGSVCPGGPQGLLCEPRGRSLGRRRGGWWRLAAALVERRQLGLESIFDLPRIDFSQAVLGAKDPVCPDGGI